MKTLEAGQSRSLLFAVAYRFGLDPLCRGIACHPNASTRTVSDLLERNRLNYTDIPCRHRRMVLPMWTQFEPKISAASTGKAPGAEFSLGCDQCLVLGGFQQTDKFIASELDVQPSWYWSHRTLPLVREALAGSYRGPCASSRSKPKVPLPVVETALDE